MEKTDKTLMKPILLIYLSFSLFVSKSYAIDKLCPPETVADLIRTGLKPIDASTLCSNFVACKMKSSLNELKNIGFSEDEVEDICSPYIKGMERVSKESRETALANWRFPSKPAPDKVVHCPAVVVKGLMRVGFNLHDSLQNCGDYKACEGKDKRYLEIMGQTQMKKLCTPSRNAADQLNEKEKSTLEDFVNAPSQNTQNFHNSQKLPQAAK